MAFDPSSAQEIAGYNPDTNTLVAPAVNVGAFDPSTAKSVTIPFDKLIELESKGNQFSKVSGKPLTSSKGAIGIAQLLPSTAKDAAKLAGVEWNQQKFLNDATYNRQLGEAYYNKLLDDFNGDSYKAAAAYNAGPARIKKLEEKFGEDWADKLPQETKNYIGKLGYTKAVQTKGDVYTPTTSDNPIIDYAQLAEAGKFGAGAGAVLGAVVPEVRAISGAIRGGTAILPAIARGASVGDITAAGAKGFAEGVLGSAAGQVYQYGKPENLQNDLTRMGIEMATGAGATGLYEGGLSFTNKVAGMLPNWAGELVTKPLKVLTGKSELEKNLASGAFGRLTLKPGTATDNFTNASYQRQTDRLAIFGLTPGKGEIPSDFARNEMLKQTRQLEKQGVLWKDSPQYSQLLAELDLVNLPPEVKKSIRNVANQQGGNLVETAATFEKNLLNLAQQSGGDYKIKDMPKTATDLLRKHLNSFYLQNTGVPYYNLVKELEADTFAAVAHDSIPTLIGNGFKQNDATKAALVNIKNSPNGVNDLKLAVSSYLKTVDDKKLISEWNDLEGMLKETKALPLEDIRALRKQVNVAKSLTGQAKITATLLAKDGVVSALSSEKARMTKDKPKGTLTEAISSPLGVFSL